MRILVTVVAIVVGFAWLGVLNGQVFTNTLGYIACLAVAIAASVFGLTDRRLTTNQRFFWGVVAAALLACTIWGMFQLPAAYRFQAEFNRMIKTFEEQGGWKIPAG